MKQLLILFIHLMILYDNAYALTINPGDDITICSLEPITLGGSPVATGGQAPYMYEWTDSNGNIVSTDANPEVTPESIETYTITVTDSGGFSCSESVDIFVWSLDFISYSTDGTNYVQLTEETVLPMCYELYFQANLGNYGGNLLYWDVYDTDFFDEILDNGSGDSFSYEYSGDTDEGSVRIRFWCDADGDGAFDASEIHTSINVEAVNLSDVIFVENSNQKFGFDDWTMNPNTQSVEDQLGQPLTNKDGSIWKSVGVNESDLIDIDVSPNDAYSLVEFVNTQPNVNLTPSQLMNDEVTLVLNGNYNEEYNSTITINEGCSETESILRVATYDPIVKTLALVTLNQSNNLSTSDVENYLNETVFNQANVEFLITEIDCDSGFDLVENGGDGNGEFDLFADILPTNTTTISGIQPTTYPVNIDEGGISSLNWYTQEILNVISDCGVGPNGLNSFDYYIFFIDNVEGEYAGLEVKGGRMGFSQPYGFVSTNEILGGINLFSEASMTQTVAHELGHGLGLLHVKNNVSSCSNPGGPEPTAIDNINVMGYCSDADERNKFRKFQWDIINF